MISQEIEQFDGQGLRGGQGKNHAPDYNALVRDALVIPRGSRGGERQGHISVADGVAGNLGGIDFGRVQVVDDFEHGLFPIQSSISLSRHAYAMGTCTSRRVRCLTELANSAAALRTYS
jgi:hypothetical protein